MRARRWIWRPDADSIVILTVHGYATDEPVDPLSLIRNRVALGADWHQRTAVTVLGVRRYVMNLSSDAPSAPSWFRSLRWSVSRSFGWRRLGAYFGGTHHALIAWQAALNWADVDEKRSASARR